MYISRIVFISFKLILLLRNVSLTQFQSDLGLTIFKVSDVNNPVLDLSVGNTNYKADCQIQDNKEYEKLVKCVDIGLCGSGKGEQYLIKISSIVRKTEKNVK